MIPTGLQDKVNLPLVGLTLLRLPTPHLEPCLHLADFFFFFNMGKEKENKNKKSEAHHLLSSILLFPETDLSPRTTLLGYLEVLHVWLFRAKKVPLSWSCLLLESFSRFCPGLFSRLPEAEMMNSPSLSQRLSPSVGWLTRLLPGIVPSVGDVVVNNTRTFPALMELIIMVEKDNKQVRGEVLMGQSKSKEEKDEEMQT